MRHTSFFFALLFATVIVSSCGISKAIDQAIDPTVFASSGKSPITLQQDTVPVIVVLDQPTQVYEANFIQVMRDSLQKYGIVPQFEVYGPLSLQRIERELPRIERIKVPYLWIETKDYYTNADPISGAPRPATSIHNIRLQDKDKTLWRANSIGLSNAANSARAISYYIMDIMRKDGVISQKSSVPN
jgi:hypothetical protein